MSIADPWIFFKSYSSFFPNDFSFQFISILFSIVDVQTVGECNLKNSHICQSALAIQEYHNVFPFLCEFKFIIKVWISLFLSSSWKEVKAFQVMFCERTRNVNCNSFKRLGL